MDNDYLLEEVIFILLGIIISVQLTFLLLKLFNVINWSWWTVSAPFILESFLALILFIWSIIEIYLDRRK